MGLKMDKVKIEESFVKDKKGILIPRSIVIKQKYHVVKSARYKHGCVLIAKSDYDYLLKLTNEAENERFK